MIDSVVRDKPKLIKRTRDRMWISNLETMVEILDGYHFTAEQFVEEDHSITLSLNEIDLVENAGTVEECKKKLAESIMEYSWEYYNNYSYWHQAPNRKKHVPYVFKALIMDDTVKLGDSIICQNGKN